MRSVVTGVTAAVLALSIARPAHANGRFPAAGHLVASSSSPPVLALETTFGLVVSRGGAEWDWICERAMGYSGQENATVAIIGDDRILAGSSEGLSTSRGGCEWQRVSVPTTPSQPASRVSIIDIARPIGASALVLARVRGEDSGGSDAGRPALLTTLDGGATFKMAGPLLDPALVLETVDVAARDPSRVYLSGIRVEDGEPRGVFLVSTNGGISFSERPLPLAAAENAPFIAAVDPVEPDRVYVRTSSAFRPNRLFVTDDAGETFRVAFVSAGPLLGFALSADGREVYAGGPRDGLHRASATDLSFTKVSDEYVGCLATVSGALHRCSPAGLDVSDDRGETFRPLMRFSAIRGPLGCGEETAAHACAEEWPGILQQLGGPADAGASPVQPPEPPGPARASCATDAGDGARSSMTVLLTFLLLALGAARRFENAGPRSTRPSTGGSRTDASGRPASKP